MSSKLKKWYGNQIYESNFKSNFSGRHYESAVRAIKDNGLAMMSVAANVGITTTLSAMSGDVVVAPGMGNGARVGDCSATCHRFSEN